MSSLPSDSRRGLNTSRPNGDRLATQRSDASTQRSDASTAARGVCACHLLRVTESEVVECEVVEWSPNAFATP